MDISLRVRTLFVEGNDPVQGTQRVNRDLCEKAMQDRRKTQRQQKAVLTFPIPKGCKWCADCGEWRPTSYFSPDKRAKDGLHVYCKMCRAETKRLRYAERKALIVT